MHMRGRGVVGALAAVGAVFGMAGAASVAAQDDEMVYLGASLFGSEEVGGEGAPEEAGGDFNAELDLANGRMCYILEVYELDGFAAAHVHEGARGKNGPPVITLELVGEDGEDVCQDVDAEVLKNIAKKPANYYANVHTAAFPAGAVRGQLGQ